MKQLIGVVFMVAGVMTAGAAAGCEKPAGAAQIEAEVMQWINAERGRKGLSQLGVSAQLRTAAEAHACDMAKRRYFAHEGPGGPSFKRRLGRTGYSYGTAVENIAASTAGGAEPAKTMWRKSAPHWANLTNRRLDDMAVAVAWDGSKVLYVFVGAGN